MLSFFFAYEHKILPSIFHGSCELPAGHNSLTSYMLVYKRQLNAQHIIQEQDP